MILGRYIRMKIRSADLGGVFHNLSDAGVELLRTELMDPLTAGVSLRYRDMGRAQSVLERAGAEWKVLHREGCGWLFYRAADRPVLMASVVLVTALSLWLPSRVLFVETEGNDTIPAGYLREKAELCGLRFGMERKQIWSEPFKNRLLQEIPQLQWAGITTRGAAAVIHVKEGRMQSEESEKDPEPGSLVALRDAIVSGWTVRRGTVLCKMGQAVRQGEILVSGFQDCGRVLLISGAEGEVYGETAYKMEVLSPQFEKMRTKIKYHSRRYSLVVGKKRIKCYNGSGILNAGCVKISRYKACTLPGEFTLPLGVLCEDIYETELSPAPLSHDSGWLADAGQRYLLSRMIAGRVLSSRTEHRITPQLLSVSGDFYCEEMIGKFKSEENEFGVTETD